MTVSDLSQGVRLSTTRPENPVREGYYFSGWYADKECTQTAAWSSRLSESVTLYAGWMKIYTFEAEYVDLEGKRWQGLSDDGVGGNKQIQYLSDFDNTDELVLSGDAFVGKLFYNGAELTFNVSSDENVENAVLYLRLSPDIMDATLTDQEYQVIVNGELISHNPLVLTGAYEENGPKPGLKNKRPFEDYLISNTVCLKKGNNEIQLLTNNNYGLTGTYHASTPLVDCMYLCSDSNLYWTEELCHSENVGVDYEDISYDVSIEFNVNAE